MELRELTLVELEAIAGGGIIRWTELGDVEGERMTVAQAYNDFYQAAGLPKPFP